MRKAKQGRNKADKHLHCCKVVNAAHRFLVSKGDCDQSRQPSRAEIARLCHAHLGGDLPSGKDKMTVYLYDLIREGKIPCARQEMLVRAAYRGVSGGVSAPASVQKKARTFDEFNAFYKTQEWRKLRYEALKKYGPKCMLCGASKSSGAIMHVDHIKPRFRFPELELELSNLQILCEDCNMGKRDCSDWRLST